MELNVWKLKFKLEFREVLWNHAMTIPFISADSERQIKS